MSPNKETIEEFKKIYQEEFGETISDCQAFEKFLRLVNLLRGILKKPLANSRNNSISGPYFFDDEFKNDKLKE